MVLKLDDVMPDVGLIGDKLVGMKRAMKRREYKKRKKTKGRSQKKKENKKEKKRMGGSWRYVYIQ